MTALAELWRSLRSLLQTRGELPLNHEVLTPAEIAASVKRSTGDTRVHRFVWDYYYPQYYGGGGVADVGVSALVDSFQNPHNPQADIPRAREPGEHLCGICSRNPVQGSTA